MTLFCRPCGRTSGEWVRIGVAATEDGGTADIYKHRPCGSWAVVNRKPGDVNSNNGRPALARV